MGILDEWSYERKNGELETELAKVRTECKEWEEAYYNQVGIREDELKPKIARLEAERDAAVQDAERFRKALDSYERGVVMSSHKDGYINVFLDAIRARKEEK